MANIELEPGATNPPSELQKTNIRSALGCGQTGDNEFSTNKATLVDGDKVAILDSAASDAPKHGLWSLVKSTLKTYFDTLYSALGHTHVSSAITDSSTGGNGASDSGKLAKFGTSGELSVTDVFYVVSTAGGSAEFAFADASNRSYLLPGGSGYFALTSQANGTITTTDVSGLGAAALLATSSGGNFSGDSGKVATYSSGGRLYGSTNQFGGFGVVGAAVTNGSGISGYADGSSATAIHGDARNDAGFLNLGRSGIPYFAIAGDYGVVIRDEIAKNFNRALTNLTFVDSSPFDPSSSTADIFFVDDDFVGSDVAINLPAAADSAFQTYRIKKLGTTGNVVIDGNGSETIDGSATAVLTTQYESLTIVCDGSNWHII